MRLTNPSNVGLPGLAEIRKGENPHSSWEGGGQWKRLKDNQWVSLFSEKTRLQNLFFLLWPACSFLASCPVTICHWQPTVTQHRVVAAAAVLLFSSNGRFEKADMLYLIILMLQMSTWGINRNPPDGTLGDCFQSRKNGENEKALHRKL